MTDLKKQITGLDPGLLGTAGTDLYFPAQVIGEETAKRFPVKPTIVEEDADFTFDPEVHGCNIIHITAASDINCTVPADVTAFVYARFIQRSTGAVTFVEASGATVTNMDGCYTTAGAGASAYLEWLENSDDVSAEWQLEGRLQA